MKVIAVENPGTAYRLRLLDGRLPLPGPGEVRIKVAGAGLNRADILQAMGRYPPPPGASEIPGMEVAGVIDALGEGIAGWRAGDAVCALLTGGGYAEYAVAAEECVLPAPEGVDLVEAAGLPEAFFTVWANLMRAGRLRPGETVLVHGGASGIGVAAIQLCAARGHPVFATASKAKCETVAVLGAAAIDYEAEDFVAAVKDKTGGRGADVILDMVGGDYVERNFQAAAKGGRIVNIAFQRGFEAKVNFAPMLAKHLTMTATTLRPRSNAEKGAIRDALLGEVWPPIEAGRIRPVTDRIFPLAEAEAAHARMREGRHSGKILLQIT
jgi:NADPH:quinone reductase